MVIIPIFLASSTDQRYLCTFIFALKNNPMKRLAVILIILISAALANTLAARNLWAFLTYATFNSPEGPYVETYLSIDAKTVKFVLNEQGKYQATVNVLMTFRQGNEIKAFKKYELSSTEISDTTRTDFHFVDQQRIPVPNGTYDFEIQLADKNRTIPAVPYNQNVVIDFPSDKPVFSGIELVKSYKKTTETSALTKSGYDLVPNTFTFYPENESKMIFYAELYNTAKLFTGDQKFILNYYLESFESNLRINDYARSRKETPRDVVVILTELDIANLPSGNYNLVLEARDQKNEVIALRKLFIQRMNPTAQLTAAAIQTTEITNTFAERIINPDTLREYINSTYPIATGIEKAFIRESLKKADLKTMQQFLYSFWFQRVPSDPALAWQNYNEQIIKVQQNFGTPVKKGYQTDRGRVYLQYGPPNTRSVQLNEPSNYPYEIWHYYTLSNNQSNRKFVFYSPDLVTSDFILLHSDAIGEVNNPRWKVDLRSRIYSTADIQDTQVIKAWGDFEQDYWDLPN